MTAKFFEHKTVDKTKKAKKSKKVAGVIKGEMVDPIRKFIKERNLKTLKDSLQKEYMKTVKDRKKYVFDMILDRSSYQFCQEL